jgi:hypothetical protein
MNCKVCGKEITQSYVADEILCNNQECFNTNFWNQKVEMKNDPRVVRAKSEHYFIDKEEDDDYFRGFNGAKFIVKFFDGREITTTNLRCNGTIPTEYRELLPDNAEIILY